MMNKPKKVMGDEEYEKMLEEETDNEDLTDLEETEEQEQEQAIPAPQQIQYPKKMGMNGAAPTSANTAQQGRGRPPKIQQATTTAPQVSMQQQRQQSNPRVAPKRFAYYAQKEVHAVIHADTGEAYATPQDMPAWAAQMWTDIKNDLDEIKDVIGKI